MSDTANMLGQSKATVSRDIKLAEAMEVIPELKRCKNKKEAMKVLDKLEKQYHTSEIVKKIEAERETTGEDQIKTQIINSYILGDFFKLSNKIPDGVVDLCEVDPPFGIKLQDIKDQAKQTTMNYNEWPADGYAEAIRKVLKECFRVVKDGGWLIWWFAYEPWFEVSYQEILRAGFRGLRTPAVWIKPTGHTSHPATQMASAHEPFFYARKGSSELIRMGRPNYYKFKPVAPDSKIHPTEKPVELMEDIYLTFASPGARILIPFAGSGNGILAAYNVHMTAFGYDLSKAYRDGFVVRADRSVPPNYRSYR